MNDPLNLGRPIHETEAESRLRLAGSRAGIDFPERAGRTVDYAAPLPASLDAPSHGPVQPWEGHCVDVLFANAQPGVIDRGTVLLGVAACGLALAIGVIASLVK